MDEKVDLRDVSVLVLDDIPAMRRLLGEVLRGLGCGRVFEASNADAAMQLMLTTKVDVVLSDVQLGAENGLAFVREVRSASCRDMAATPIIMVSAHSTRKCVEAATQAGATYFLAKPISIRGIAEQLARVVSSIQTRAPEPEVTETDDVFLL